MARFDRYVAGQFSWVDLMSPDPAASAAFYGSLLGWQHTATKDDTGGAYTMFELYGQPVAGMGTMPEELRAAGVPPSWSSYVTVENADAMAAKARDLGAELQMPVIDIVQAGELVGRMTVLGDPEGARLSLWQPGRHPGAGVTNEPGTFGWNELCSKDVPGAKRFYADLFGWEFEPQGDDGYQEIRAGGRANGGILPWRPDMGDMPAFWSVYFAVEDCDAAVKQLQELGGALHMGPVDIDPGRFAVVSDDQGAMFNLMKIANPD